MPSITATHSFKPGDIINVFGKTYIIKTVNKDAFVTYGELASWFILAKKQGHFLPKFWSDK